MKRTVLILTQRFDPHADLLIEQLRAMGERVVRYDTADFPMASELTAELAGQGWDGRLTSEGHDVLLQDIRSVWYRRPRPFRFPDELSEENRSFARREAVMGVGGVLRSLDCLWVNHPERLVSAEYKPFQLESARRLGLTVPRTLITNSPAAARTFFNECHGEVIYKTLSPGVIRSERERSVIYTSRVQAEDLGDGSRISLTATLLQEYVPKDFELRVTVMADAVFTASIRTEQEVTDWRQHYDAIRYDAFDLPKQLERQLLRLVRSLGLVFAAIDLIVRPDGDYVFIELNPSGQWAWIESQTRQPMIQSLAELLAGRVSVPTLASASL